MSKNRLSEEKKKPSSVGPGKTASVIQKRQYSESETEYSEIITEKQEEINPPKTKDGRYRYWTIVVYPESAPTDWREKLNGLQWVESPLHDQDINPDGSVKKPHWHIIIFNQGKITYNQAKKISDSINGASPQYVQNITGMIRYLAHLDNPEKAQYEKSKIIGHGVDVLSYFETASDIDKLMREIENFVRKNKITEYSDLVDVSNDLCENYPDWHRCITTHTIHFRSYVASKRHKTPYLRKEERGEE